MAGVGRNPKLTGDTDNHKFSIASFNCAYPVVFGLCNGDSVQVINQGTDQRRLSRRTVSGKPASSNSQLKIKQTKKLIMQAMQIKRENAI